MVFSIPIGPKNSVGKIRCRDAPSPNFFLLRFSGLCFVQRYFVVQDSEFSALTVSFRFINGYYFSNRWWDIGPDVGDGAPIWEGVMAPFLMALAPSLMRLTLTFLAFNCFLFEGAMAFKVYFWREFIFVPWQSILPTEFFCPMGIV